jgi:non-specific serine/threonine protein kinase
MGEVYRARDSRLKRDVALKVLPPQLAGDRDRLARFQREAEVLASLNHPQIAQIYGLEEFLDGGVATPALVMELVEGDDLAQRIASQTLGIHDALAIAGQIVEALQAAHQRGIVHRDLKPANIKVRADGTVKVLDFGLAKAFDPASSVAQQEAGAGNAPTVMSPGMTHAGAIVGTPAYMSPEQARGQTVDTRTDIWAFGCVLFEMLAGRPVFAGRTPMDTLAAILEREPDWRLLPEATPDNIQRLLRRCLDKRSASRVRDIGDARFDIDDALASRGGASSVGDGVTTGSRRHNLPAELTSFVGRQGELAELTAALGTSRLLSLTGAGGAGKTRLALRLAADLADRYRDGAWMVDLSPIAMPDLVPQTVASAIGVREAPQRSIRDTLLDNLRSRELLIVLDNCEHLIDACAEFGEALLRAAPALRIVATSREPLRVPGETVWRVSSLSLPEESASQSTAALLEAEATRLFIERATSTDPSFKATAENAATISRICRRLDGIPLAIELAAARADTLSVEQIDARLQDRFRLLTGAARTAVPRQRTLEATMQWSYQLLSAEERLLLNRLSVFPGRWSLDAAEKVCGGNGIDESDMLDLHSKLVSKSLIALERHGGGDRRYRLLETIRHYARERLMEVGGVDQLRDAHFEYFFTEFRDSRAILQGHGQVPLLKRLRLEQDNVRAALEWGLASPRLAAKALELTGALFWYWTKQGAFEEGRQWLEGALAIDSGASTMVRATALIGLAHMCYFQGRFAEMDLVAAEASTLGHAVGDPWAISWAAFVRALAAFETGNRPDARALATAALATARSNDDAMAGPLLVLGNLALMDGDIERADQLFDQSNDVNRRSGEVWGLAIGLLCAAGLRIVRGDFTIALQQISESLSINEQLEDPRGIAWSLDSLAGLLGASGPTDAAARLWGASDHMLENVSGSLPPFVKVIRDRYLDVVRASLGTDAYQAARDSGWAMTSAQAITFAREQERSLRQRR